MGNSRDSWKYVEVDHTADAAIIVSGENLPSLFQAAVLGMYSISGAKYDDGENSIKKKIWFSEGSLETLLISFLNEMLFLLEEGYFFKEFYLEIDDNEVRGSLTGFPVNSIEREIKAVTFSEMKIVKNDKFFSTKIVFDI